ncbi:rhodanese-like domain-containing protein [Neisseria sp. 83E34]|uniref:rhodanese-like domain-containing protein n=1 Tax=Neisseria sp. 83E34 TaxID=1692264 RepID=UPI0006CE786C|nr:rhodanese-like domain-containing protein [Neisseria sp. 83E34]KPN72676.1 membrane protein [Neisseria sp. 83E34]
MSITTITAADTQNKLQNGAVLIDIRGEDEYRREHIENALLQPLPQLQQQGLPAGAQQASCVIFHCKSGMRTRNAANTLAQCASGKEAFILENGIDGWKSAGLPTQFNASQPLELMRQVQIAAGSLALAGAILGWLVSPAFYLLCAFVGAGLLTAGLTGFCGMARLLMLMPWNRR